MTNWAQIHEFYKKDKQEIFIFRATVLKFVDLLEGWKMPDIHKITVIFRTRFFKDIFKWIQYCTLLLIVLVLINLYWNFNKQKV